MDGYSNQDSILSALNAIDPARLTYQEWCNVGMALKLEGYSCDVWDAWSRNDSRYHSGECQRKWDSFHGASSPVTGGTIVQMAKEQGWVPAGFGEGFALEWDSAISSAPTGVLYTDTAWIEGRELHEPTQWDPAQQIIKYLETLFESTENVGIVTEAWEKDGKYMPTKGFYTKTAGELIQELGKCGGDIGKVVGDYNAMAGAWIRFNPLDGKGVKNENVTDYRYALVESDKMELDKQNAIVRELELPVACLVHSGKKSIHAIVRIDASTLEEYRKRVDYLYSILRKNGMDVDTQNKNPSRLSRLPGIMRDGKKQYLIDTNIGKASFTEWKEWIESLNDDLPDILNISTVKGNRPPLAPELIHGVLRKGHKMLLSGASKASKSFALIELAISIAEGQPWMGFSCDRGRVLYVNLELDTNSCWNRILDVYETLGLTISDNIDVWPLRGKAVPMGKLAPKLIRRSLKKEYVAIIIDPIYKVITGDENSADQMAAFCNQFDRVATELGCAVIYCHHHSKGAQGGKRSMDRASGSGVFARDPDALLDMMEIELPDNFKEERKNTAACRICKTYLLKARLADSIDPNVFLDRQKAEHACRNNLPEDLYCKLCREISYSDHKIEVSTALRIEGTLREFPRFAPVDIWFEYPIHTLDSSGDLAAIKNDNGQSNYKNNFAKRLTGEAKEEADSKALEAAFVTLSSLSGKNTVPISDMMNFLGLKDNRTLMKRVTSHGKFGVSSGKDGVLFML